MLDIILPFHRIDKFFNQAVNSISSIKNVPCRIILVDDREFFSNEITASLAKLENHTYVRTRGGVGYGASLEIGSAQINAEYVSLFNSDDLVDKNKFLKQMHCLSNSDISLTAMTKINKYNRSIPSLGGEITSSGYHPSYLLFGSYGANATWCMKRSWWEKNAFFDSNIWLDWRIALGSFNNSSISYINQPHYYYRKHSLQSSSNKNYEVKQLEIVYQKWRQFNEELGLSGASRNVFHAVATPWLKPGETNLKEIQTWLQSFSSISQDMPPEIVGSINKLIARRMFYCLRSPTKKVSSNMYFLQKGLLVAPRVLLEVIKTMLSTFMALSRSIK